MSKEFSLSPMEKKSLQELNARALQPVNRNSFPGKSSGYVYVNRAYAGSLSSLGANTSIHLEPPTSVVREQYWACTKWPRTQQCLAIAVGVLIGAVIGLVLTMSIKLPDRDTNTPVFRWN